MPFRLRALAGCALLACLIAIPAPLAGAQQIGQLRSPRLLDERTRGHHAWIGMHVAAGIRQRWLDGQALLEAAKAQQAAARRAARESERPPTPTRQAAVQQAEQGSGRCGGDLPPCYVMRRESGGDIRIWNGGCYAPIGWEGNSPCGVSSASGKWQFVRRTWASCGFPEVNAADASEAEQDACARQVLRSQPGAWG